MTFVFLLLEFRIRYLSHSYQGSWPVYVRHLKHIKLILFGLYICCSFCIQAPLRSQLKCHLLKEAFSKLPIRVALLVTFASLSFFFFFFTSQHLSLSDRSFIVWLCVICCPQRNESRAQIFFLLLSLRLPQCFKQYLEQIDSQKIFVEQNWPKLLQSSLYDKVIKTVYN